MYILGVHLDPPFIRTALIRKRRRTIEIRALHANDLLPQKSEASFEGLPPNVKRLYMNFFKGRVASGLSAKNFLIRSVELKIAHNRHIEEAIAFQSEATCHFNPADLLSVPLIQKREKGVIEALLFMAPREIVKKHLSELQELQIDPDGVSTTPLALYHFIRWKFPQLLDAFIVDLGSSETTCILIENGRLKKAHAIAEGIENLLAALLEDRKRVLLKKEIEGAAKQIDLLLLKPGLNPHLTAKLSELRQEIAKTFYSFCREAKKKVIFTGRPDAFVHLREFLIDSPDNESPLTLEEQKFAIALGFGLEQTSSQPLQLRRQEFFPKKNWNRIGFYALLLLTGSILLSGALFGIGIRASHARKMAMLHSLHLIKGETAERQIDNWIASVEKGNKEYPYLLQAPKVVEFLSWFSSHPLLEELKQEGDPIDLRELRYRLVSLPKITSPKEPYLAKVELEFQFKNAMNARRFHEALRKGDKWINPNLEISWDSLNEGYRVSFFLKNRSPHVP